MRDDIGTMLRIRLARSSLRIRELEGGGNNYRQYHSTGQNIPGPHVGTSGPGDLRYLALSTSATQ